MYKNTNSYLPVISKCGICPNFYKLEKCTMDSWTNYSKLRQLIYRELSAKVIYKITKIFTISGTPGNIKVMKLLPPLDTQTTVDLRD